MNPILIFHLFLCVLLVVLVLLQQGKGADVGAAFGGGSSTLFGATGATNVMVKITTGTAILFMATSIFLIRGYAGEMKNIMEGKRQMEIRDPLLPNEETSAPSAAAEETAGAVVPVPPTRKAGDPAVDKNSAAEVNSNVDGIKVDVSKVDSKKVVVKKEAAADSKPASGSAIIN